MRIKAASPQEREQLLEQLIQIGDGLAELDALPPDPERLVFAADRAGFGMKTTPELLETLLTEAAATVTSAADAALARIHRRRASGQCPEAAGGCSCESGIMVLKQQSRPQNKEHPIDATTQPSRSHPNRV